MPKYTITMFEKEIGMGIGFQDNIIMCLYNEELNYMKNTWKPL